jgi:putative salt-induced outer membrane protein
VREGVVKEQMRRLVFVGVFFLFFSAAPGVYSQDKDEKRWTDEAELSFVDTGGNTDLMSLSAKNLLTYTFDENLSGMWKLSALYGESDGVKNAERYATEIRLEYLVTEQLFSSIMAGWLKDEFSGIYSRYYLGPGVGYKFLAGPKHFLEGELGVNYVTDEYTDDTEADYMQGRAFGKYEYAFTKKNKFSQSVEFLYDFEESENYNINSETALISALSDYLSLKATYEIKYDNEPVPATLEETDTILSITLVVTF